MEAISKFLSLRCVFEIEDPSRTNKLIFCLNRIPSNHNEPVLRDKSTRRRRKEIWKIQLQEKEILLTIITGKNGKYF